jgi:hypothetical protein
MRASLKRRSAVAMVILVASWLISLEARSREVSQDEFDNYQLYKAFNLAYEQTAWERQRFPRKVTPPIELEPEEVLEKEVPAEKLEQELPGRSEQTLPSIWTASLDYLDKLPPLKLDAGYLASAPFGLNDHFPAVSLVTYGYATTLGGTSIPEPSISFYLAAVGCIIMWVCRRSRKHR